MWDNLLKVNPRLIVILSKNHINIRLFNKAIEYGYKITIKDLEDNKLFCQNDIVMKEAIKINPNYIRYYLGNNIELIEEAIAKGYIPNIKDLKNNPHLNCVAYIQSLVKNGHPEAIKYFKERDYYSREEENENIVLFALESYHPSFEEVKQHPEWCRSEEILIRLIKQNASVVKLSNVLISWNNNYDMIALEHGYHPTLEDIKNNDELKKSEKFFEILLKETTDVEIISEIIRNYHGYSDSIIQLALDKGYQPTLEDIKQNENLRSKNLIMEPLIKQDPMTILLYNGGNEKLFEMAYNMMPDKMIIKEKIMDKDSYCNLRRSRFIMRKLIEEDYHFIEYYTDHDLDMFLLAFRNGYQPSEEFERQHGNDDAIRALCIEAKVKNGYIPTDEEMEIMAHSNYVNINYYIPILIDKKPEYIKYYTFSDEEICWKAINAGYPPSIETIKALAFNSKLDILVACVKLDSELLEYLPNYIKTNVQVLATDDIPSIEELKRNGIKINNYEVMKRLLLTNHDYIQFIQEYGYTKEEKIELYNLASDSEFIFTLAEKNAPYIFLSDKIMEILIQRDSNYIKQYAGENIEIFELAIREKYESSDNNELTSWEYSLEKENNAIISLLQTRDFQAIHAQEKIISSDYLRLFKVAMGMGYIPSINNIAMNNILLLNDETFSAMIDASSKEESIRLLTRLDGELELIKDKIQLITDKKDIDIPHKYFEVLKYYSKDKANFITHYSDFKNFLLKTGVEEKIFVQYAFGGKEDWLSDILKITESGKIEEFIKIKDYFLKEYYQKDKPNMNEAMQIKAFVNILKNYRKYPELCNYIMNERVALTPEVLAKLDFLFESNEVLTEEQRPKNIEDLNNIEKLFANIFRQELSEIKDGNLDSIKSVICRQLFGKTLREAQEFLSIYGDTKELRQLMFDNRNNVELHSQIQEMMIYTSMIESVIEAEDKEYLLQMSQRISDNYLMATKCVMLFTRLDDKMQNLYSRELSANLTQLRDGVSFDAIRDDEMSEKVGVEVLDFSNRLYCLMAHVMSYTETAEQLIQGESSGNTNFISLSAISNRNQVYYGEGLSGIIFGYDSFPDGNFIRSSPKNFGTNGLVSSNSLEVSESGAIQRGALKTSTAPGDYNSEILCFRQGLRPKYIILPGGRMPTDEEIEVARQYGLKFVKTQPTRTEIKNPQEIPPELLRPTEEPKEESNLSPESLREIMESIQPSKQGPRRIAIFTDAHALFEPTLAILEDARKSGITEIYSLGDNIGTGPNPKEVVELLEEYGVQSLAGNHELYTTLGTEAFRQHLVQTGALQEAKNNSAWTRTRLTEEQIERLRSLPEQRTIEIGGQRILLTHYLRDYNNGQLLDIPDDISQVFQGHTHFENEREVSGKQVTTVRGAGIGNRDDKKNALYIILTERPDGGYDIERRTVDYDYDSLHYDIMLSEMLDEDREKMLDWAGVKNGIRQ